MSGDDEDEGHDRFAWMANDGKVNSDKARVTIEIDDPFEYDDHSDRAEYRRP